MMEILLKYLVVINIVTYLFFAVDKRKAKKGQWRIRESVLLGLSLLGGAAGGLCAMYLCHHKTKKVYFSVGLPVMLLLHLVAMYYIYLHFS